MGRKHNNPSLKNTEAAFIVIPTIGETQKAGHIHDHHYIGAVLCLNLPMTAVRGAPTRRGGGVS